VTKRKPMNNIRKASITSGMLSKWDCGIKEAVEDGMIAKVFGLGVFWRRVESRARRFHTPLWGVATAEVEKKLGSRGERFRPDRSALSLGFSGLPRPTAGYDENK